MATDLLKFIDNNLVAEFHAKALDHTKDRTLLVKGIERTVEQVNSKTPVKAPNKWAKSANDVVELTVKLGSNVIPVAGKQTNYIPLGQFKGFADAFAKAVQAGEFDQAIADARSGSGASSGSAGAIKGGKKGSIPISELSAEKRQSSANKDVGTYRYHGNTDDQIRDKLAAKGHDKATIEAALVYKKPGK